jgi:hypothetical protein
LPPAESTRSHSPTAAAATDDDDGLVFVIVFLVLLALGMLGIGVLLCVASRRRGGAKDGMLCWRVLLGFGNVMLIFQVPIRNCAVESATACRRKCTQMDRTPHRMTNKQKTIIAKKKKSMFGFVVLFD